MQIEQQRRLYIPALSILAVVLILLIFISVSTYRNFNRNESNMLQLAHRQGLVLLNALEAGARSGVSIQGWNADALKHLIIELGTNQDIAYLFLLDPSGTVIFAASPVFVKPPDVELFHVTKDDPVRARLLDLPNGRQVYEMGKHFSPELIKNTFKQPVDAIDAGQQGAFDHEGCVIVLGLEMVAFNEVRRTDLHHAVVMGGIVLALGVGVVFFFFVIRKYIRVNRALRQAEDYTRQVVASLAAGLVSIDSRAMVRSFNIPALDLLGVSAETLKSRPLHHLLDFADTGIDQTLKQKLSVLEKEITYRSGAGSQRPLAISVTPINQAGDECCGAVIVLRDLSEIKDLEAQMRRAEKLAAVGGMAASVAHEIRNPLSSVKGFAQYLQKGIAEGAKEREYTEVMIQELDRINAVVTDLLTFARPMEATPAPANPCDLVDHVVRLVRPDADARNIVIKKKIDDEGATYHLDADQLTQVLLNLLLNAIHAVGRNGIITIGVETSRDDYALILWVEDDGPGIPGDLHEKVFEPFFTMREKGTGLGLAIVHKIVEHHNGRINVASPATESHDGSRFTIHLPVTKNNNPHMNSESERV